MRALRRVLLGYLIATVTGCNSSQSQDEPEFVADERLLADAGERLPGTHCGIGVTEDAPHRYRVTGRGCAGDWQVPGLRLRTVLDAGSENGILVSSIREGSIPARAGLENGDVIVAVNGMVLSTAETALATYDALRHAPELRVDVLRGGHKIRLTYFIEANRVSDVPE